MKVRKIIAELLVLLLAVNFFYEGIYKIAYWHDYSSWLHNAPGLGSIYVPLTYVIPIGEVLLAIALLVPSYRSMVLLWTIILQMGFILWIAWLLLFTRYLFWPYHAIWRNPSWVQKAMLSVGLSWIALAGIILPSDHLYLTPKYKLKKLKNNLQ